MKVDLGKVIRSYVIPGDGLASEIQRLIRVPAQVVGQVAEFKFEDRIQFWYERVEIKYDEASPAVNPMAFVKRRLGRDSYER